MLVDKYLGVQRGSAHPIFIDIEIRCRRCYSCRRYRSRLWMARALEETKGASRTWFCTYTLNPEEHWRTFARAVMENPKLESESDDAQFIARHNVISGDITRYIKRVRKAHGRFRYLFVAEKHASGLPHYHALIHELQPERPLRKALLKEQWKLGFCSIKLVKEPGAATYVCKYLAKEAAARVRASLLYGNHYVLMTQGGTPYKPDLLTLPDKLAGGKRTCLEVA